MNTLVAVISLAAMALICPAAIGQQPKLPRVAFIFGASTLSQIVGPKRSNPAALGFVRGLQEQGYVEGRNVLVDWRTLEGKLERFEEVATDVLRSKPDVILMPSAGLVRRFSKLNTTIPVVASFAGNELVGTDLVRTFAHPGGNITGLTFNTDSGSKRLELLLEIVPKASRIAYLATNDEWQLFANDMLAAAKRLGVTLFQTPVGPPSIADAWALMERERPDAVSVPAGALTFGYRQAIGELAAASRIPTGCGAAEFAEHGCLMSYGTDTGDLWRRAAGHVAKILKGAKPGDLPIEQPTKFELVVNLKTAKALGITIPRSVLVRADRVIE